MAPEMETSVFAQFETKHLSGPATVSADELTRSD